MNKEFITILKNLEEYIENSPTIPFTNKCMIAKEEVIEMLKDIKHKLPNEYNQGKGEDNE